MLTRCKKYGGGTSPQEWHPRVLSHCCAVRCEWTYTTRQSNLCSCGWSLVRSARPFGVYDGWCELQSTPCTLLNASERTVCIRFVWLDIGRWRHWALHDWRHRIEGVMHRHRTPGDFLQNYNVLFSLAIVLLNALVRVGLRFEILCGIWCSSFDILFITYFDLWRIGFTLKR